MFYNSEKGCRIFLNMSLRLLQRLMSNEENLISNEAPSKDSGDNFLHAGLYFLWDQRVGHRNIRLSER